MGDTALEIEENETDEQEVIVEEDQTEKEGVELDEEGNPEQEAESEEVDIVLDVDEGSQPDEQQELNRVVRKRVNRLNAKVAKVEEDSKGKDQQIQLLTLALEQQKNQPVPLVQPDPREFDDGTDDPKYVEALQGYNKSYLDDQIKQATASLAPQPSKALPDDELERSQIRHYENAETLGIKDYDETEAKAIEILGKDTVNQFIKASEKSHLVLYHLGKNLDKAEDIADLIKSNPIKGTLHLGALGEKLKVKPRRRKQPAPDPDEELRGSSSRNLGKRGPAGATYS